MKTLIVSLAALALVAGQATVASAAAKDAPVVTKASMTSCAVPAKSMKLAKAPRVENRCEMGDNSGAYHVGVIPLVFGGAIVAGVVAIAVTNNNNNSPTSP